MINKKLSRLDFTANVTLDKDQTIFYKLDGHAIKEEPIPPGIKFNGREGSSHFLQLKIAICPGTSTFSAYLSGTNFVETDLLELQPISLMTSSNHIIGLVDLHDIQIRKFIAYICKRVYEIYKLPSVERYVQSHVVKPRKIRRKHEQLSVTLDFEQFLDLASKFELYQTKFELYQTIVHATAESSDQEAIVNLVVKKSGKKEHFSTFYLALSNEGVEELKRFITEVEQKAMINRLTKG